MKTCLNSNLDILLSNILYVELIYFPLKRNLLSQSNIDLLILYGFLLVFSSLVQNIKYLIALVWSFGPTTTYTRITFAN